MPVNDEVEELLRFDPFNNPDEGEGEGGGNNAAGAGGDNNDEPPANNGRQQPSESDGAGEAGGQHAEGDDGGKPEDSAAADDGSQQPPKHGKSGEPDKGNAEVEALKEQIRQQGILIQNMQQQQAASQGQQGQGGQQAGQQEQNDPVPDYTLSIPHEIVEGLADDDSSKRSQALQMLVAGIGKTVHQTVRQEFQQKLDAAKQSISQENQQRQGQQSQTQQITTDYFGKYPTHGSQLLRPIVQQKAQEVMAEWNVQQWSPEVRDEIARRVDRTVQEAGFQTGQQQQPSNGGQRQNGQRAPHMRRGGASPAGKQESGGPNSQADIHDTLFGM